MFKKVLRIILWSMVVLLLGVIIYFAGAMTMMTAIEEDCNTIGGFSTTEDSVYMCMPIRTLEKKKEGVDS